MVIRNIQHALIVATGLVLGGCGDTPPTASKATPVAQIQLSTDPAADLVRNFKMGSNLEQMANAVAASTHTYASVSPTEVSAQIRRLVPKYQAQWDANLAKAHAAHLSPEELRSLAAEGRKSPFYSKLEQKRPAIAANMKVASATILERLVADALASVAADRASEG